MMLGVVKMETFNFVGIVVDRVTLNILNEQCNEWASMGLILFSSKDRINLYMYV